MFRIRNRLKLNDAPIMVDDITVPAAPFAGLTEAQFRDRPSTIYNLYQESFGISVVRTRERLRASVADTALAGLWGSMRGHRCYRYGGWRIPITTSQSSTVVAGEYCGA